MRTLDPEDIEQPNLLEGDLLKISKSLHLNAGNADVKDERDEVHGQLSLLDHRIFSLMNVNYIKYVCSY